MRRRHKEDRRHHAAAAATAGNLMMTARGKRASGTDELGYCCCPRSSVHNPETGSNFGRAQLYHLAPPPNIIRRWRLGRLFREGQGNVRGRGNRTINQSTGREFVFEYFEGISFDSRRIISCLLIVTKQLGTAFSCQPSTDLNSYNVKR